MRLDYLQARLSSARRRSASGGRAANAAHRSTGGHPYRIKDYYAIDSEYGSEADLKALVDAAHQHGLKLMMDVVFYHTAPDSVMLRHPEYHMHDAAGGILLGNWKPPRPDFTNPALRRYLIHNLLHWVKAAGVDGFRCDVSGGIPLDSLGTSAGGTRQTC